MGVGAAHPTDQLLQAHGLSKLDQASAESVSKHLEDCAVCRQRVAELSSDDFLGRLRNTQVERDRPTSFWSPPAAPASERATRPVVAGPTVDAPPPELANHPDYEIVRELGRGGMGVVYLANNRLMRRLEVLKVVGRHLVDRPGVLDRFLREIRSAAKLQHANIVTAYNAMRLGENVVLAMEYVDGLDLARTVRSKGPLPVAHACHFIHQVALGLQHAHECGMVHRDIKPANLILARDGDKAIVKLLDFGLAKVTSEGRVDLGLTGEGQMLGTPDYIAPEQIRDAQSADIRADIYSLGCTLYFLLTGRAPFRGDHLWALYQAHFSTEARPLNLVRPEVPAELAAVAAKMMAKDPRRRFQTPEEVGRALLPFFKKPRTAADGPTAVASHGVQLTPDRPTGAAVSTPKRPAKDAGVPVEQTEKAAGPMGAENRWESLIEFRKPEDTAKPLPAVARVRRRWPASRLKMVTVSVIGLIALGVIITIKNNHSGEAAVSAPAITPLTANRDGNDLLHSVSARDPAEGGPETKPGEKPAPASAVATKAQADFPEDATLYAGKHYKVFDKWLTWHEARQECERMGGHLVIVRNAEENGFLRSLVRRSGIDAAWLGATDERTEGRWVWLDGTEMNYNAWDRDWGQPDNRSVEVGGRVENYVMIVVSRQGRWLDQPVEGERKWHPGFICEW